MVSGLVLQLGQVSQQLVGRFLAECWQQGFERSHGGLGQLGYQVPDPVERNNRACRESSFLISSIKPGMASGCSNADHGLQYVNDWLEFM